MNAEPMNEARATEILGSAIKPDGGLYELGTYLSWYADDEEACLDGDFTAEQLEAIAWWMRNKKTVATPNDPKLSDGGAWRGSCVGGAKMTATDVGKRWLGVKAPKVEIAATVTRGAVRCSAWLGDVR